MKQNNVLGSSRGYIARVIKSYEAVKLKMVQKYFLAKLYLEGETGYTVNAKMNALRKVHKCHKGAAEFSTDHSKKSYKRDRFK